MKKLKLPHPIKRIKEYIVSVFLPAYAKEIYEELKAENKQLKIELEKRDAYINGLETGISRIKIINNVNGGDK